MNALKSVSMAASAIILWFVVGGPAKATATAHLDPSAQVWAWIALVVVGASLAAWPFLWRTKPRLHQAPQSGFVPPQRMPPARKPEMPRNKAHIARSRRRKMRRAGNAS